MKVLVVNYELVSCVSDVVTNIWSTCVSDVLSDLHIEYSLQFFAESKMCLPGGKRFGKSGLPQSFCRCSQCIEFDTGTPH